MTDEDWFARDRLHFAARDGNLPQVKQLVEAGLDVNAFDDLGMTPLHWAAKYGHVDVAAFLLECGADVNAHHEPSIGNTALADIAQTCSLEMARLLIDAGADPTIPGWMGLDALYQASQRKRPEGRQVYALLVEAARRRRPH